MREIAPAHVVIDVDEEALFQAIEQRAPHAVTLQQDDSIIAEERLGLNRAIGKRKILVDARDAIVDDDFRVFAHDTQNLAAGKGRANAVAIRPRVRSHDKAVTLANRL